jgi:hypothetical protein
MKKRGRQTQATASVCSHAYLYVAKRSPQSTYSSYVQSYSPDAIPLSPGARGDRPACMWIFCFHGSGRRWGRRAGRAGVRAMHLARTKIRASLSRTGTSSASTPRAHGSTCVRRGGRRDRDGGRDKAAREGPRARAAGRTGKRRDEGGAQRFAQISASSAGRSSSAACSSRSRRRGPGAGSAGPTSPRRPAPAGRHAGRRNLFGRARSLPPRLAGSPLPRFLPVTPRVSSCNNTSGPAGGREEERPGRRWIDRFHRGLLYALSLSVSLSLSLSPVVMPHKARTI